MSQTISVWLLLLLALVAANLPFLTQRLFALATLRSPKKLALRLFELLVFYALIGCIALLLENRFEQITPQGWEFYAITLALFVTLSFPGFVYRYLLKRQGNV